jgi:ribose transport system substrate-binding protein
MGIHAGHVLQRTITVLLGLAFGCVITLLPMLKRPSSLPVIAFVPRTSGTSFTEDMRRGAQAAARTAGYQIYWNAPTQEDNLNRQIEIAEAAVHRGAKALILEPSNPWGVIAMINGLVNRKLPIVVVQTEAPMPTGPYLTSITSNQAQFGRLAAERIALVTGGQGEVAMVGLSRATPETLLRAQSFMRTIAAYPGIEVVDQSPGSVRTQEAEQSVRELMNTFPRLKAIFALSADATQGAMLALDVSGTQHRVALVGSDRDLFLAVNLREGKMDSLVSADGYKIGYLAVEAALAGIQKRSFPPPKHVNAVLLTRENATTAFAH